MTIEFNVSLSRDDWSKSIGGWRCDALRIPGVEFQALYHDGNIADSKSFTIAGDVIRWTGTHPENVIVNLSLSKEIPQIEEQRLRLEEEALNLEKQKSAIGEQIEEQKIRLGNETLKFEQQKSAIEMRWKKIAIITTIIGAFLSSMITLGVTYFGETNKRSEFKLKAPRIHTHEKPLIGTQNECIQSAEKSLQDHGLQSITPVQKGVYATKGKYNVLVGCYADISSIVLVVSGPEDSEAKRIREDIKVLLP